MNPSTASRRVAWLGVIALFGSQLIFPMPRAAAPPKPKPARATDRIHIEKLLETSPGWNTVEASGTAAAGVMVVERDIWPLFYLHWQPLTPELGAGLGPEQAAQIVSGLWEGLVIDEPLAGKKFVLPQHEAILFETTTSHGGARARYLVWACPQSRRLIVADMSLGLTSNAPPELMDWMMDMARTVRCHPDAEVADFAHLPRRHRIPGADLTYSHPNDWSAVPGYRVQKRFGNLEFEKTDPAREISRGQDLAMVWDPLRRLTVSWGPEADFPMSYEILRERVEEFWRPRAVDLMITGTSVTGDTWVADGMVRVQDPPSEVPWAIFQKFRAWMWRHEGTGVLAVGQIAGSRAARQRLKSAPEVWNPILDEMIKVVQF